MLYRGRAVLVIVDVQGNLAEAMHEKEALYSALRRLVDGCRVLALPLLWLEQNPERLGRTVPQVAELLTEATPIPKMSFSCCGSDAFVRALTASGRNQVVLAGIETHVCIYQTAADLVFRGYHVEVVADAVSSRSQGNWQVGLGKCRAAGAGITSVETALFEMLRTADDARFRAISRIVR